MAVTLGLGAMRLSTRADRDALDGPGVVQEAVRAGVSLVDTAHAYGLGADDRGHNERLVARALEGLDVEVVTKVGMTRPRGAWVPDGRRGALLAELEGVRPRNGRVPTVLLHAPDPRVPLRTSIRALATHEGPVGVCNVSLAQLREASDHLPLHTVQVGLSLQDAVALRSGVVRDALDRGVRVLAHSPFAGPKRAGALARNRVLLELARRHDVAPYTVVLAVLADLGVVPLPGPTTVEHARHLADVGRVELRDADRDALIDAWPALRWGWERPAGRRPAPGGAKQVVMTVGSPGSGKSTWSTDLVAAGYRRLNRDERGGTLRGLLPILREWLAAPDARVVLDNTYPSRALRTEVLDVAWDAGASVRVVYVDTPHEVRQVRVIWRTLERYGRLPDPREREVLARTDPHALGPSALTRWRQQLEIPEPDEGFELHHHPHTGPPVPWSGHGATFVDIAVRVPLEGELAVGWTPDGAPDGVDGAFCTHPPGPAVCWCRPPLPGLLLSLCHNRGIDPTKSTLIAESPAMRRCAQSVGMRVIAPAAGR